MKKILICILFLGRGSATALKNLPSRTASNATSRVLTTLRTCALCGRLVSGAWAHNTLTTSAPPLTSPVKWSGALWRMIMLITGLGIQPSLQPRSRTRCSLWPGITTRNSTRIQLSGCVVATAIGGAWCYVLSVVRLPFSSPFLFLSIPRSPDPVIPRSPDYYITWLLSWAPMCRYPIVSLSWYNWLPLTRIVTWLPLTPSWLLITPNDSYPSIWLTLTPFDSYVLLFPPLSLLVMVAAPKVYKLVLYLELGFKPDLV